MSYLDEMVKLPTDISGELIHALQAAEIAARADARIAELERESEQWRDELRIYRETENKRIAELEQAVTVRDTEIARLETDLELARRDSARMRDGLEAVYQYGSDTLVGPTVEPDDRKWHRDGVLEMTRRARRTLDGLPAIEARAGNGGGV